MKFHGPECGIFNLFISTGGEAISLYREDCGAGFDRKTGKYTRSYSEPVEICGIVKPKVTRSIIQDSGGDRTSGLMIVQTRNQIYTTDEKDNAANDVLFIRGSYWKVMKTTDYCSYWESEVQLLPEDSCRALGLE